jgi:flagellin
MVINTNTASLVAQAAQAKTSSAMDTAMERLSTGKRINTAADDAAGLAISTRMEAQIRGISQALRNAGDAQALIDTTEGAHDEVTNILQRMRELSVQAANDTNVGGDRQNLQTEITQLVAEIDRISNQTTWNGTKVLDGNFSSKKIQLGPDANQYVDFSVSSTAAASIGAHTVDSHVNFASGATGGIVATGDVTISGYYGATEIDVTAAMTAKAFATAVNSASADTGVSATAITKVKLSGMSGADTVSFTVNGTAIAATEITDASDLRALKDAINAISGTTGVTASLYGGSNAALELTDIDGDDIKIGSFATTGTETIDITALDKNSATAKEASATNDLAGVLVETATNGSAVEATAFTVTGQVSLTSHKAFNLSTVHDAADADLGATTADTIIADGEFFGDPDTTNTNSDTTSSTMSTISAIDISSYAGANSAISVIDAALNGMSAARAELGAISNRLDSSMSNLSNIKVNVQASQSRIQDADFAAETSNLTKSQILSQAATAMLAQANASKQSVLSLLQG